MGSFPLNNHSSECAGKVHKIGKSVTNLQVGDSVYGLMFGNFGNFVRVPASAVQKMAAKDDYVDMASIPIVYMTAVYAFMHLAHLSKGESVLIQSATGGLGMAAITIARFLGAEIYATVGSHPHKAQTLVEEFGISPDHIFPSRDLSAIPRIMAATDNRGIDVILCSAAGQLMHETWRCIAPAGRFVEVGRTEILEHGKLGLEVFLRNATFSSFDLGLLVRQKPKLRARYVTFLHFHSGDLMINSLMADVDRLLRKNVIKPIPRIKTFDISQLEQAMTYFTRETHIGKVVMTFSDPQSPLKVSLSSLSGKEQPSNQGEKTDDSSNP